MSFIYSDLIILSYKTELRVVTRVIKISELVIRDLYSNYNFQVNVQVYQVGQEH